MNDQWDDDALDDALRGLGTRPSDHAPVDVAALLARASIPVPPPGGASVASTAGVARFWVLAGVVGGIGGFGAGVGVGARWSERGQVASEVAPVLATVVEPSAANAGPVARSTAEPLDAVAAASAVESTPPTARESVKVPVESHRSVRQAHRMTDTEALRTSQPSDGRSDASVAFDPPAEGDRQWSTPSEPRASGDSGGPLSRSAAASRAPEPVPREAPTRAAPRAATAIVRAAPRSRPGAPRVSGRVGVGGAGGLLDWQEILPDAGPVLAVGLQLEGTSGLLRPEFGVRGEFGLLAGPDIDGARAQIGGDLVLGISVGSDTVRISGGIDAGLRVVPASPGASRPGDLGAGWWFAAVGPALGARIGAKDGPAFQLVAAAPVAILDLDGDGTLSPAPWLTVTGGVQLPFPVVGP